MEIKHTLLLLGLLQSAFPDVAASICGYGYQEFNGQCIDEDECFDNRCGQNADCFNTQGSYYCQCKDGFASTAKNFTATTGQCIDINECTAKHSSACPENSECKNTIGSFHCECLPGFQDKKVGSSYTCADIDECVSVPTVCGRHGVCRNTLGSFTCLCPTGFRNQGNSHTPCEDIDECDGEEHVCGEVANCSNSEGSFYCQCSHGYSNYGNNKTKCTELNCNTLRTTSEKSVAMMDNLLDLFRTSCESLSGSREQRTGERILENLLNVTGGVLSGGNLNSSSSFTVFFGAVENTMRLIAPQLNKQTTRMDNGDTEAWLTVRKDQVPPTGPVILDTDTVRLNTSWKTAVGDNYPGYAFVALVSYKSLNSTSVSPPVNADTSHQNTTYLLNSQVVTALVSNKDTHSLPEPITLTFRHKNATEVSKGLNFSCVYWAEDQDGGVWSGKGCVQAVFNSTHAVCSWSHLSSFAVLMALYPFEENFNLEWITKVGLTLSIICLFFCILTFLLCRSIKGTRTTIHLHLCVCLFIANIIFLFFISKTHNKVGCASVAALLHFFYLAAFCFMLLEGVQLYRMVVLVFHTTLHQYYLYAVGYGVPLIIVIISAMAFPSGYGTPRHCWLSLEKDFIWSFFAPVCIIILLNSFFFVVTVWKLVKKFSSLNPDLPKLKRLRGFLLTAVAQLCVLGGMWVFGCFLFQEEGTLVIAYLFTVFTSLQGALIFIMHCLMSKQVREEYKKLFGRICKSEKKRYSEFSTNQSSNSQRPLRSAPSTGESQI